jgi:hypothetical protein
VSADAQSSLPQWAINALVWICLALSGAFIGSLGWILRKYTRKVDDLENLTKTFATTQDVLAIEMRIAPMVSRAELLAHLQQMREDNAARDKRMQDERERMHQENKAGTAGLREELREARADVREIHKRIDDVLTK